jgi:hypothetical protein
LASGVLLVTSINTVIEDVHAYIFNPISKEVVSPMFEVGLSDLAQHMSVALKPERIYHVAQL